MYTLKINGESLLKVYDISETYMPEGIDNKKWKFELMMSVSGTADTGSFELEDIAAKLEGKSLAQIDIYDEGGKKVETYKNYEVIRRLAKLIEARADLINTVVLVFAKCEQEV